MKGIYLFACRARHENYDLDYNDVDGKYGCNITGDAMKVSLKPYDFIVASPPCNWWSKANPYYKTSQYALNTKHLLPDIINKLGKQDKPFIIENVKNKKRMLENGIFDLIIKYDLCYQFVGRHIYISNVIIDLDCPQHQDFVYGGKRVNNDGYNQGGSNVHIVIEKWLENVKNKFDKLN